MALRSDWSEATCPIARAIDVVGDPWTLLILREALSGARRFEDFKRRLQASDNILAARLAQMVADGLLQARPYSGGDRPRREYLPTRTAADAVPILQALAAWGHDHRGTPADQPAFEVICGSCGRVSGRSEACEHCGALLDVDHGVAWSRPDILDGKSITLTAGTR
jgi:DNA-binding HxlR family transcriptional regulator